MPLDHLRLLLEMRQIPIYFGAVMIAFVVAWLAPAAQALSAAIDPMLGLMLFATFLQVPMGELHKAMANVKFVGALATANFVVVPLLVACLLPWAPGEPLARMGLLLVLLTPCIDYVVTFAHLGRADARSLLASTPLLLLAQMLLLPLYLGVFLGEEASRLVRWEPFLHAFVWLIAVPLVLAGICQAWAARTAAGRRAKRLLGLLPVPATAAVLAVVVAAVTPQLGPALGAVRTVAPLYVVFAVCAPIAGWIVALGWRLQTDQRIAVAFSTATRNSLVILPLALAVPGAVPILPAVIVAQTLIELVFELIYVKVFGRGMPAVR